MKKSLIFGAVVAIGLSSPAFASGLATVPPAVPSDHFEVIGALGIASLWANDADLGVTSSQTDRLVQTNGNAWNIFAAQLGLGYVFYFNKEPNSSEAKLFPSIEPELNVYYLGNNTDIKGDVWEFGSANFNDLTYEAHLKGSMRLMLDAALTVVSWNQLSLYAKGGIGNAWHRMSYRDKDNAGGCVLQRLDLNSKSHSNFAWEAGAGLSYAFNNRFGLSLEYLYSDLGKASSSAEGDAGTITEPVIVPPHFKLKAQTVLLGLHIAL